MSQPPVIAVIAAGEMGAGLGGRLAQDGARVLTSLAGRSENSRRRAAEAGMIDAPDEELAAADLIISLVPPIQALALAERLAPAIARASRAPLYADANAVSPDTVRAIAAVVEAAGARMVDAGVIGLAPRPGYQPTVYASGSYAPDFKALTSPALDVRLLDGPVGQASALKLSYSAINKGTFALVAAAILGACEAGVGAELDAQLASSQPGVRDYLQKRMPGLFPKAYRWDAEMREIAAFLGGPASHIYEGAAQMFDRLATDHAGAKADETAILTFLRGGTDKA